VFDKDGTLIDFAAMWGGWAVDLNRRLASLAGPAASAHLGTVWGFDPAGGQVEPGGRLAVAPMNELYDLAQAALRDAGLSSEAAIATLRAVWQAPDPVALARPLADLPTLFGTLREAGIRTAIATTDDRVPTVATLEALGVLHLVDAYTCGDDDLPLKPEPDAFLEICRRLGIPPARAVMIGDTAADMRMGRAAGAGLVVGVLSGAGTAATLGPLADLVIPSVAALLKG
jgi:phosphoglycolate phosphatase-like HAD superfamily hydrolase